MELKQIRCTTCGESLSIETALKEIKCQACGNAFLMTQGIHLNSKSDDEIDTLKNLRIQLKRSVERQDIQSIEYHALEILKIIPDDYVSQYFFSYASYNLNKPKAFYEFLELDIASTQEDKRYVIEHMKAYADIKEYEKLHQYVDRVYPEMSEVLTQTLNQRIQQEDHYSVIDRDVFICHRSTDNKKALKVLNALEADGHTCWISSRNLRPDDSINYWSNIEEAIENCRVFLVISSQSAMLSKDVQKELQLANKMNKAKIEYKIDESVHTTLFKRSFDGVKWIEAIKGDNIETLQERVLDALEEVETKQQPKKIKSKVSLEETIGDKDNLKISNKELKDLFKAFKVYMKIQDYDEALVILKQAKDIDVENQDVWKLDICFEHRVVDFLELNEKINNMNLSENLDELMKIETSKSVQNYIKLFQDDKAFNVFIKDLKDKIVYLKELEVERKKQIKIDEENQEAKRILFAIKMHGLELDSLGELDLNDENNQKFKDLILTIEKIKHPLVDQIALKYKEFLKKTDEDQINSLNSELDGILEEISRGVFYKANQRLKQLNKLIINNNVALMEMNEICEFLIKFNVRDFFELKYKLDNTKYKKELIMDIKDSNLYKKYKTSNNIKLKPLLEILELYKNDID